MHLFHFISLTFLLFIIYHVQNVPLHAQTMDSHVFPRKPKMQHVWQQPLGPPSSFFYRLPTYHVRSQGDYLSTDSNYLLTGLPLHLYDDFHGYNEHYSRISPIGQGSAVLTGKDENIGGFITFQQIPHSHNIKITLNATGLPPGKHALHIHTYGDISDDCEATGGQFPNTFLGNVEAKEDGTISMTFLNMFLHMFGFNGIIGRSVVIHENPIDINTALNADVFSGLTSFENEEKSVGNRIACGIISITNAQQQQQQQGDGQGDEFNGKEEPSE